MAGYYPISTNFKTLSQYDFEKVAVDEILFFEWLMIKRLCFGDETFFYQRERVEKEIGIKKARFETIKGIFIDLGLIVEQKGWNHTTHYTVNDEFVNAFLTKGLKPDFKDYVTKEILNLKFNEGKKLSDMEKADANFLLKQLNGVYNDRRKIYSDKPGNNFEYSYTQLPANEKELGQLLLLKYTINNDRTIINSFTSFIDSVIEGAEGNVISPISLFTKVDKEKGAFPKFDYHLSYYNQRYSRPK